MEPSVILVCREGFVFSIALSTTQEQDRVSFIPVPRQQQAWIPAHRRGLVNSLRGALRFLLGRSYQSEGGSPALALRSPQPDGGDMVSCPATEATHTHRHTHSHRSAEGQNGGLCRCTRGCCRDGPVGIHGGQQEAATSPLSKAMWQK